MCSCEVMYDSVGVEMSATVLGGSTSVDVA